MKYNTRYGIKALAVSAFALSLVSAGNLRAEENGHEGDDHAEHADEVKAGPNGGKIIHEVEPHLEFFVTKDRKVQITALDKNGKGIPITTQSVSVTGGERSNPTRLKFEGKDGMLISDGTLPEGNDFPVVVMIKPAPDQKSVIEKFNLNMNDCPTCKYAEYACVCDHGGDEEGHEGHDH